MHDLSYIVKANKAEAARLLKQDQERTERAQAHLKTSKAK